MGKQDLLGLHWKSTGSSLISDCNTHTVYVISYYLYIYDTIMLYQFVLFYIVLHITLCCCIHTCGMHIYTHDFITPYNMI